MPEMTPEPANKSIWEDLGYLATGGLVFVVVGAVSVVMNFYLAELLFQAIAGLIGLTGGVSRTAGLLAALVAVLVLGAISGLIARWLWNELSKPAAAGILIGAALSLSALMFVMYVMCC
jgi:hypothetical protein